MARPRTKTRPGFGQATRVNERRERIDGPQRRIVIAAFPDLQVLDVTGPLEESTDGVDLVAAVCGFGSPEAMRRAFRRTVRVSPSAYRACFANQAVH